MAWSGVPERRNCMLVLSRVLVALTAIPGDGRIGMERHGLSNVA